MTGAANELAFARITAYWRDRSRQRGPSYVHQRGHDDEDAAWRIALRHLPARCPTALDFGCGHGRFSARLLAHADEVVAADVLTTQVAVASSRADRIRGVVIGPDQSLPVADASVNRCGAATC